MRLQCYEGLDVASAVHEWNYAQQMLEVRLAEASGERDRAAIEKRIFGEKFLIKRPILRAIEVTGGAPPALLIDEIDGIDEPFEPFLLEERTTAWKSPPCVRGGRTSGPCRSQSSGAP